jgi:ribosomal protein S18 acetylase RimI-like enzyme
MNHEINFKFAKPNDVGFVFESLKKGTSQQNLTHRFSLTKERLWDALFSEKAFAEVLLAHLDNQPIGLILFSMTQRNFDLFHGPGIYIHCLYVAELFRRMKAGTQLIEQIKKIARERDCSRIDWVVLKQNRNAIDFYKNIHQAKEVDNIHYMRMEV